MIKIAEDALAVGTHLIYLKDMIAFLEQHEWDGKILRVDEICLPTMAEVYHEMQG